MKKRIEYTCPECGEDMELETLDWEMDCDCYTAKISCSKCEAVWYEYFKLTYDGYGYNGKVYDANGEDCNV